MPNKTSSKSVIVEFLEHHGVSARREWRKERLLKELEAFVTSSGGKEALTVRAVEEIARTHNIEILRLPPYHCQFNPIEHVWGWMKAKLNDYSDPSTTRLEALCRRAEEIVYGMPEEMKVNFFNNAIHEEDNFIEMEGMTRTIGVDIEPMVIELDEDEDDPEDFFDTAQFLPADTNLEQEYEEESEEAMRARQSEEAVEEYILEQISHSSVFHPNNLPKRK